ncbi:MAG: hypothetical protein ACP5N2_04330 [Candidatus Nanoarchaeia archaeon]
MKNNTKINIFFFILGIVLTLTSVALTNNINKDPLTGDVIIQPLTPGDVNFAEQTQTRDKPSPDDYFQESNIKVYKDRVILDAENVQWAAFKDTKSMLPVINKDSNALQIVPKCPEEIKIGDIVSYASVYSEDIIIHRVTYIGNDDEGIYFILKGDNNPSSDPGKIRCSQIQRKVIAIIY